MVTVIARIISFEKTEDLTELSGVPFGFALPKT